MNYSTWIIVLSLANVIAIYSGFPMGTKKAIIIATTLGLLFIGFIFRAIEQRQRKKLLEKKQAIKNAYSPSIDQVAREVAHDIHERVESEIDQLSHQDQSYNHYEK